MDTDEVGKKGAYAYGDKWLCENCVPGDILHKVKIGVVEARAIDTKRRNREKDTRIPELKRNRRNGDNYFNSEIIGYS